VALVRTDVPEEPSASFIRATRIGELETTLAVSRHQSHGAKKYYKKHKRSVRRLLVTANVVPSAPILVTLMMEETCSSEPWNLRKATRRNIPEDRILHSDRRESLKSYITLTGSAW
jgi:hypothetical protein